MRYYRVGDIDIAVAIHGRGTASPHWMFPDIPPHELNAAVATNVDDEGNIEFVYSSLIVRTPEHLVLVDAGPASVRGSRQSSIAAALNEAGHRPRDVDTVVISHGHDDHVGGLTDGDSSEAAIAFPNARHFVARAEFGHWTLGPRRGQLASEKLMSVNEAETLTLVDGPRDVVRGVSVLPAPGHTPGHLAVVIGSGDEQAIYVGDALAHAVNVPHPEWNHFSDMRPGPARKSRHDLVERAAAEMHLILASHIPFAGRIRSEAGALKLVPEEPVDSPPGR